jgi:hypothetical protein
MRLQDTLPMLRRSQDFFLRIFKKQTIFVGNTQHEQVFDNNVIFYYLAEHASATKYIDLHPGVATTAAVQNQIINDIAKHDTNYLVLWNDKDATRINTAR